jgi:hypothetical protein
MAQTWEDKAGQHTAWEPIFLCEEGALHTSDEFQMVCVDCGSLAITIANPEETNREAIVHCGGCNSPRGTMGGLRDLAVRADAHVPSMHRQKANSPSDLVARHKELQSLRRKVQIAESNWRASPPVLPPDRDSVR